MAACSRTSTASTAGVSRFPNRPSRSSVPDATAHDDPAVTPPRRTAPVKPKPARSANSAPGMKLTTASMAMRRPGGTVAAAARRSAAAWSSPTEKRSTTTAISAAARVIAPSGRRAWSGPTADTTRPTRRGTGKGSNPLLTARRAPTPMATSTAPRPRSVPASRLPGVNTGQASRSSTSASTPSGVPTTSAVSPAWRQKSGPGAGKAASSRSTATIETPVMDRTPAVAILRPT